MRENLYPLVTSYIVIQHRWPIDNHIPFILGNLHEDSRHLEIRTVEARASIYSGRRVFDLPCRITSRWLFFVAGIPTLPQASANQPRHRGKEICTGFGIPSGQIQVFLMVKSPMFAGIMLISMFPIRSISKISHLWFERCPCFCDPLA